MAKNVDINAETENEELTQEEIQTQARVYENDIIAGMLAASDFHDEEQQEMEIIRNGTIYFSFKIHGLTEDEYNKCKKKYTKYVKNKSLGVKMPEETNTTKYRSALIYAATTEEDKSKTWDNKSLWSALTEKGKDIVTATDVVDAILLPGEKARILECIDKLSGYDDELEEVAKK